MKITWRLQKCLSLSHQLPKCCKKLINSYVSVMYHLIKIIVMATFGSEKGKCMGWNSDRYLRMHIFVFSTFTAICRFPYRNGGMIEMRNSKVHCFICYHSLATLCRLSCSTTPMSIQYIYIYIKVMLLFQHKYRLFSISFLFSLLFSFLIHTFFLKKVRKGMRHFWCFTRLKSSTYNLLLD